MRRCPCSAAGSSSTPRTQQLLLPVRQVSATLVRAARRRDLPGTRGGLRPALYRRYIQRAGWVVSKLVALLALLESGQPSAAHAQDRAVHLEWDRPIGSTCPPANVLETDVEETLGRKVFTSTPGAELSIQGRIEEQGSETLVHLTARNRHGRVLGVRELHAEGGGCAALRSDIVLVLTLLVDREDDADEALDVSASFGAAGTLLANVLPRWAAGAGPVLVLDIEEVLQLRADLSYFFPVAVRTTSGVAADLHAASVTLRVCPRLHGQDSALSLHVCGGLQAGAWLVAQTEPSRHAPQVRLLAQGLLELRLGLSLGERTTLTLGAGPSLSIVRPSLYATFDAGAPAFLYRVPLVGAQVQLGLTF